MAGLQLLHCSSILLVTLIFTLSGGPGILVNGNEDAIEKHARDLIQWLKEGGGGFIHENIEIRRRDPGDSSSPSGIFARGDIAVGELIFHVPREFYLSIYPCQEGDDSMCREPDGNDEGNDKDERRNEKPVDGGNFDPLTIEYFMGTKELIEGPSFDQWMDDTCRLSKKLLKETKLFRNSPSLSRFAPYISYLEETQAKGQLPATYSPEGKSLLRKIQGIHQGDAQFQSHHYGKALLPPLDLVDWIDRYHVKKGCFDAADEDGQHAVALVIQRGFDQEMIPVWDMVNHDVQERVNVETNSLRSKEGLKVWASQPIAAGGEILYSYNYCTDCYDHGVFWGTPGMYRDFGFLEEYPQEWAFLDQNVLSQIRRDHSRPGHFYAEFISDKDIDDFDETTTDSDPHYFTPNEEAMHFFREQLSRLDSLDVDAETKQLSSPFERIMIRKYYDSLRIAIHSIITAPDPPLTTSSSEL